MEMIIKRKKSIIFTGLLAGFCLATYFYATPYLSILKLKISIDKEDFEAATEYIDFPSVRKSLKSQLRSSFTRKARRETIDTPFGALTVLAIKPVINIVIDSTIDSTVSPTGLKILLTQGKLGSTNQQSDSITKVQSNSKSASTVRLYYNNINNFILTSNFPNFKSPIKAYWKRYGITNWKLSSIELPNELIDNLTSF